MSAPIAPHHRGGTGTPLVLLHGFTGSWRIWRPLLPTLQEHHDVFAPSLPGHAGGPAVAPGDAVTVRTLADHLEAQLDEQGIGEAHLAGNSLGGWLALELGRRGRATTVTAISPGGGWNGPDDVTRVARLIRASVARTRRAPRTSARLLRRPRARRAGLLSVAEHGDRVSYADTMALIEDARACTVVDAFLDGIAPDRPFHRTVLDPQHPITIAWADRDRLLPFGRYGRPLMERCGAVELVRLPGVGHVPMLDDPVLVTHTILATTHRVDHHRKASLA